MCKFFTLTIPMPDVITDIVAWWELKYDGSYIAVGSNTYSLDNCQKADRGLICTHRSPVFEPCLLSRPDVNMCTWTLCPQGYNVFKEVDPQQVCLARKVGVNITEVDTHLPFSSCIHNTFLYWR